MTNRGIVVALAAGMLPLGGAHAEAGERACTKTSKAAAKACSYEVQDDYWIGLGVCTNTTDPEARAECVEDVGESLTEARDECRDQLGAREELCEALGQAPYDPVIDPASFLSPEDTAANPNPYLPLVPGAQWVYAGDGETITVTVTNETKEILGVETMVVTDTVFDDEGNPVEITDDWFAQDVDGNVWYFGEIALNYEDGEIVDIEGSWEAGVDGAKAGIVMLAMPMVGNVYRQEFALGNAEDAAEVLSTTGSEAVPGGSCDGDCLITEDFTPIDPDAVEHKYYAPGTGLILELDPESGERVELQSVSGL